MTDRFLIHNGDCLEELKKIEDKSINLVLIDPPYNIGKDKRWDKWKTVNDYVEFMGKVFKECERVLKDNGSFYFFHNDFLQIVELQNWINKNTKFKFKSFIIWDKGDFRALSWKNPSEKSKLRSWFNTCEYCLYYTFQDDNDLELYKPIRDYFKAERKKTNLSYKELNKLMGVASNGGGMASNILTSYKKGWTFPTEEKYKLLQTTGICQKPYEELRQEYEKQRYIHNLDENHKNVWYSNTKNNGKLHNCQKPLDILERIIKTSTNEDDVVLDCFAGSGSTGVACMNTNRKFIGIELDKNYFDISEQRIKAAAL